MKKLFSILLLLGIITQIQAQEYTISGFVEDKANGEKLLGSNIYNTRTYEGAVSNTYGFYSLKQAAGEVSIKYSFVGFQDVIISFSLIKDTLINIELSQSVELREVEIISNSIQSRLESTQMSTTELQMKTLKNIPVFFGEVDIMKTLQLMPGVQSGSEGTSGLYVRGGGPDQNLILLDGVPVYNANHLFGFFSVFNADAINSVTLVKGGFPARYGGRLSSVLDIRMKEGNSKEFHGEGSIGLIASKITLEGPIIKDKASFIVSARRTYIDVLAKPFVYLRNKRRGNSNSFTGGYYFYDLNAKINYKFSNRSRLYLSAYHGNDKAYAQNKYVDNNIESASKFKLRWGNITTALRWNYIFSKNLFANTRFSYSRYNFLVNNKEEKKIDNVSESFEFSYFSGIDDMAASIDFDYIPLPNHYIRFGISNIYHQFNPGVNAYKIDESETAIDTTHGHSRIYANEIDLYIEDDFSIGNRVKINIGLHASGFYVKNKLYTSLQPRGAIRVIATEKLSLKASYSKMEQNIHLLSNTTVGMPTDLWVPVTDKVKPMKSQQIALGAVYNLNNEYEISFESYYKWMHDLITYKPGSSYLSVNNSWQDMITIGQGWTYGGEFLIKKEMGKFTGWIGYTLSWSWRKFDEVSPNKYPYRYDRRHDISVVGIYKLNEKVDFGAAWVYGSGNAVTLPYDKYLAMADYSSILQNPGEQNYSENLPYVNNIETRNNYRAPAYHRLDLSVNFHKETKWGERTWSVGIYNAYFRQIVFFLYIEDDYENFDQDGESKKVLKQVSLFPGMPYVSYNFKF